MTDYTEETKIANTRRHTRILKKRGRFSAICDFNSLSVCN